MADACTKVGAWITTTPAIPHRLRWARAKKSVSAFIADLATKKGARLTDVAWAREVAKVYGSWVGPFPEMVEVW